MPFVLSSFLDYIYPIVKDAKEFVQTSLNVLCDGDFAIFDNDESKKIDPSNILPKLSKRGVSDVRNIDASKDKREYLVDGKYLCRYIGTTFVQDITSDPNGLSKIPLYPMSCDVDPNGGNEIIYNLAPLDGKNYQLRILNPNSQTCTLYFSNIVDGKPVPNSEMFQNSMTDGSGLFSTFVSIPHQGDNILINITFNAIIDENSYFYSTSINFRMNNEDYSSFITTSAFSVGLMWGGQIFSFLTSNVDLRSGNSPFMRYMLRFPENHQEFL